MCYNRLGFLAWPLAIALAGTPGWPIQVSPRMTSFIGMGHHPGPMPPALMFCLFVQTSLLSEGYTHTHLLPFGE